MKSSRKMNTVEGKFQNGRIPVVTATLDYNRLINKTRTTFMKLDIEIPLQE